MKVTVVATVLNNEDTVSQLADSLLNQTRKADEILFVDGGSTDNTVGVLKHYAQKHSHFRIISRRLNKAESRNTGIEAAAHSIIAQIDGSCVANRKWLSRLVKPLRNSDVGVSAGFYKIMAKNAIAKAASPFIGITSNAFDPRTYMPTGRSLAIRKSVWLKMGKYSEDLQWSGEDNLFNYKLLKNRVKLARVPSAIVYWYAPSSFREIFEKIFAYTAGISQTGTWRHPCESLASVNVNISSVYFFYTFISVLLFLSFFNEFPLYIALLAVTFYLFTSLRSKQHQVKDQIPLMLVPVVQIISDVAVMFGFASGFVRIGGWVTSKRLSRA